MKKNELNNNLKLKSKTYSARFLEAGVVKYGNDTVLIKNENLMNVARSFKGIPVIIEHKKINENNIKDLAVGYISRTYFNELDGWAWCDFNITDEKAKALIENGYSVSCAYIPTKKGVGGVYHNIPYKEEIIGGEGTHLALVSNPRYEEAIILENSKQLEKKTMKIFKFKKKEEIKEKVQEEIIENELENSLVEIDGEKVEVSKLIEIYNEKKEAEKKAEEEKQNTLSAEDEVEINGEKVQVSELVNAYKEKKSECKEKKEKKKEDEKKNQADFNELKNAKKKAEVQNSEVEVKEYKTDAERYAEGQERYGSPQVINEK
jgi:hypothetical protein